MLGQLAIDSMLHEFADGYIFKPFGEAGRKFIVARSSSSAIVAGTKVFGHTVFLVIGAIVAAGLYYKYSHNIFPGVLAISVGLIWIFAFYVWAKIATRGLIEYSAPDAGGAL